MAKRPLPTPEVLRQLFRYEPQTGKLFWQERGLDWFAHCKEGHQQRLCRAWNQKWAGTEAGCPDAYGYIHVALTDHRRKAHRIIWAMQTGRWPAEQIDHINGDRGDNRWSNLRHVTRCQNQQNMRRSRANTSGVTGVSWCERTKRWEAEVRANGERHRLGMHRHLEDARRVVEAKRQELGFPARHGRSGKDFDAWRANAAPPRPKP